MVLQKKYYNYIFSDNVTVNLKKSKEIHGFGPGSIKILELQSYWRVFSFSR